MVSQMNTIDLLIQEYQSRKFINSSYSERAFARDLGLSPGYYKLFTQKKRNLSSQRAKEILTRLKWSKEKKAHFLSMLIENNKHQKNSMNASYLQLEHKEFFEISKWFHFAIVELIKIKKGEITGDKIAKYFNIPLAAAKNALNTLTNLGLLYLNKDAKYETPQDYEVLSFSSETIKNFHKQILKLASDAVDAQEFKTRENRSLVMAFDSKCLPQAKEDLEKFIYKFNKKYTTKNSDRVYVLNANLFSLGGD